MKELAILQAMWVYLGISEDCNSEQVHYGEP